MMSRSSLKPPFLIDTFLFLALLVLVVISLLMVYSTTGITSSERFADNFFFVKRQGIAIILGFLLLYLASHININFFRKINPWCYLLAVLALALVLMPGIGVSAGGAQRWINLGVLNFQPAELVKLLYVIFLSGYISRNYSNLSSWQGVLFIPLFYLSILAVLLLQQPDFGSCFVLYLITLFLMFTAGVKLRYLLSFVLITVPALLFIILTSPYRARRLMSFLNPQADPLGDGYQLNQSLIAVSSGGLQGVGMGESMQKLYFLPEAHTDFIFAVIAEEFGIWGSAIIIAIFLLILYRGMAIAGKLKSDIFSYSLAVGFTLLIVIPAFFNMSVVLGLAPTKGLTLPMVSYGGSSMLINFLVFGFLLALAKYTYRNSL